MPTISGLRKRGYTPESLRNFVESAGVAKRENIIEASLLEFCIRDHLNKIAPRINAVMNPVKLTIINYDKDEELLSGEINPEQPELGNREFPFSKNLLIEHEDFKEEANRKFFRLSIGKEVRLKNAYIIKGESVIRNSEGEVTEILCTYDKNSKSGSGSEASKRKVKGTLHWVSEKHSVKAKVKIYDRLFTDPSPDQHKDKDFIDFVNPDSLLIKNAFIEPSILNANPGEVFQFQRIGYFKIDEESSPTNLIFNKTVGLRDNWIQKK
jgi:glutaminyl-tRNA synthetase